MKSILSIIYVYYNTPGELLQSLRSISVAAEGLSYEIIVVDNASSQPLPEVIRKNKRIILVKNKKNLGYGKALNCGAKHAIGKYLLMLNPDTRFEKGSIKKMVKKIEEDKKIGIIGPQIIDNRGNIAQSISGMPLLPGALVIFSFLRRLWPFRYVYKKYHHYNLARNKEQNVDVVGGVCMFMRRSVFDKIRGFDERFFMYFEEADFCYRIRGLGLNVIYLPQAKVVHLVGRSTQDRDWIRQTFEQSRYRFFLKYHGFFYATVSEFTLRLVSLTSLVLIGILLFSAFLNFYRLKELMPFIGDQGWFYLSARDMILTGKIPLVGIPSSHPWLSQGPLWTYILAVSLWIGNFNPISGAYLTAFIGVVTVFMVFKVGSLLFSERVGLIAAGLYATAPLIIVHSRMSYHTSPIPLFTLFFIYSLYKLIKGNQSFFPLVILFLAILYNLELFTSVLWFVVIIVLFSGVLKKKMWLLGILNRKTLFFSVLAFIVPMMPILIYDIQNELPQTVKFVAWIGYRILRFLGLFSIYVNETSENLNLFITTSALYVKHLVFLPNETIAVSVLILSFGFFFTKLYHNIKKGDVAYMVLGLTLIISLLGYFVNKIPSEAYIPVFFPLIIFLIALFFENLTRLHFLKIPSMLILLFILFFNAYSLFSQDYLAKKGYSFIDRLNISKQILKIANGREYNLIGKGEWSQFESFTMNYEYLTWWLGNAPTKEKSKVKIFISEDKGKIKIDKNIEQ